MTSESPPRIIPITDNLRAVIWNSDDNPQAAIIYFQARQSEENVCFQIRTSARIISHMWKLPQLRGGHWLNIAEHKDANLYEISIDKAFLDIPFIVGLELDVTDDPARYIIDATIWDKAHSEPQIVYIEFNEAEQDAAANP